MRFSPYYSIAKKVLQAKRNRFCLFEAYIFPDLGKSIADFTIIHAKIMFQKGLSL